MSGSIRFVICVMLTLLPLSNSICRAEDTELEKAIFESLKKELNQSIRELSGDDTLDITTSQLELLKVDLEKGKLSEKDPAFGEDDWSEYPFQEGKLLLPMPQLKPTGTGPEKGERIYSIREESAFVMLMLSSGKDIRDAFQLELPPDLREQVKQKQPGLLTSLEKTFAEFRSQSVMEVYRAIITVQQKELSPKKPFGERLITLTKLYLKLTTLPTGNPDGLILYQQNGWTIIATGLTVPDENAENPTSEGSILFSHESTDRVFSLYYTADPETARILFAKLPETIAWAKVQLNQNKQD